jgi:hypothetical protein
MTRHVARHGLSLLVLVLASAVIASVFVLAYHFLWRGSSRTLFSVQEQRELVNLGRSALADAYFELQKSMDESGEEWVDWCIAESEAQDRTYRPAMTIENAAQMTTDARFLAYDAEDVKIRRVLGLTPEEAREGKMGLVDLEVTVGVRREAPRHQARLYVVARHAFRFAQNNGPFGGRHVELTPTPVATGMEAR